MSKCRNVACILHDKQEIESVLVSPRFPNALGDEDINHHHDGHNWSLCQSCTLTLRQSHVWPDYTYLVYHKFSTVTRLTYTKQFQQYQQYNSPRN